ncbi:MAG: RDD family protein [Actinomycetales bacterium]|nr:RDD family protein [Actinomycetales bacterium]
MAKNAAGSNKFGDLRLSKFPGERLGLPETGTRSVARIGRRIAAISIDWALAVVVAMLVAGKDYLGLTSDPGGQFTILGTFVVLQVIAIPFIGGSIGHRLCSLHVVTLRGKHAGIWRPLVRTALLALVLPAIVWDSDQRGFHDKIAGTMLLRA